MITILLIASVVAFVSCVPMNVCNNYEYLYDQCLPPTNWMCEKPNEYISLDLKGLKKQLRKSDPQYVNYVQTCSECLGEPTPYPEEREYIKEPVCREVHVPVEYVNKAVKHPLTGEAIGNEVCEVVLNKGNLNIQKVYRTECYNGNKNKKHNTNQHCNFDYGIIKDYFCRPTNFVYRTMLVYCHSSGLQYYKEKVSTACSCVRMKCV